MGDNIYKRIIWEVLLLKYSFFYDFVEIIEDSPIIILFFLIKSGYLNHKIEIKEEFIYKDDIYNLNI